MSPTRFQVLHWNSRNRDAISSVLLFSVPRRPRYQDRPVRKRFLVQRLVRHNRVHDSCVIESNAPIFGCRISEIIYLSHKGVWRRGENNRKPFQSRLYPPHIEGDNDAWIKTGDRTHYWWVSLPLPSLLTIGFQKIPIFSKSQECESSLAASPGSRFQLGSYQISFSCGAM
jgi:hypothetical protein